MIDVLNAALSQRKHRCVLVAFKEQRLFLKCCFSELMYVMMNCNAHGTLRV